MFVEEELMNDGCSRVGNSCGPRLEVALVQSIMISAFQSRGLWFSSLRKYVVRIS